LFFALLVEDYERVITHYIQQSEYLKALKIMARQSSSRKQVDETKEIFY